MFNLRRQQTKTKVLEDLSSELLFVDDCALAAHSQQDLQVITDHFADACKLFGLTISLGKTEVMYQPAPGKSYIPPVLTIEGYTLKAVSNFFTLVAPCLRMHTSTKKLA